MKTWIGLAVATMALVVIGCGSGSAGGGGGDLDSDLAEATEVADGDSDLDSDPDLEPKPDEDSDSEAVETPDLDSEPADTDAESVSEGPDTDDPDSEVTDGDLDSERDTDSESVDNDSDSDSDIHPDGDGSEADSDSQSEADSDLPDTESDAPACSDDAYEPNNDLAHATAVALPNSLTLVLDAAQSPDLFRFDLPNQTILRASVTPSSALSDLSVILGTASGSSLVTGVLSDGAVGLSYSNTQGTTQSLVLTIRSSAAACIPYTLSLQKDIVDPCAGISCNSAPAPTCLTSTSLMTSANPGTCTSGSCQYPSSTTDCSASGMICANGECRVAPPTQAGAILVTEIMSNPDLGLSDTYAEWFELYSAASQSVNLRGCQLKTPNAQMTIRTDVLIAPHATFLFGRSANTTQNGGINPGALFDFALGDDADTLSLVCNGTTIDSVTYSEALGFPIAAGHSLELSGNAYSATANDQGANWCSAANTYGGSGNYGTPGTVNPACPAPLSIGWCRLQSPTSVTQTVGTSLTVYGRVYVAGLTDQSGVDDLNASVVGQAGYGPQGSTPTTGWTWTAASANTGYNSSSPAYEANNDEYMATFSMPALGTYDMAYRFSADGGSTWVYCDKAAGDGHDGSQDGYQTANAGTMVSTAPVDPCAGVTCTTPPLDGCTSSTSLVTYTSTGTCVAQSGVGVCRYTPTTTDCSASGKVCHLAECVVPGYKPGTGEVIVNEIMFQPGYALVDPTAEWVELYNTTDTTLTLTGCELQNMDLDTSTLGTLLIGPHGYALIAHSSNRSVNGNITPDATYTISFDNTEDRVMLLCDNVEVDSVHYVNSTWSTLLAHSIQLDPSARNGDSNDSLTNWCVATDSYYKDSASSPAHDNFGTPGVANPSCPEPPVVDWCRLQYPLDITKTANDHLDVFGRVYIAGLTDKTPHIDVSNDLVGQAGVGARGSDPSVAPTAWTWFTANTNAAYDGSQSGGEPNNDEYVATLIVPATNGDYDFAFRFSYDRGRSWTYCDRNAGTGHDGSQDGYQVAYSGKLTAGVDTDPCDPNPCLIPPTAYCSADGKIAYDYIHPGTCSVVSGTAQCSWVQRARTCTDIGQTCSGGTCVGDNTLVYFSEYFNGENGRDAIEIYNAGTLPVALDECTLKLYSNGSSTPTLITLGSTIMNTSKRVFFVCGPGYESTTIGCDHIDDNLVFDGNDALALECNGKVYDVIGQIGMNPGSAGWGSGTSTTTGTDLQRNCWTWKGDTNGFDTFDPAVNYLISPAVQFGSGLGLYAPCE